MSNLLGAFERFAQVITQNQRKKRFKATTGLTPMREPDRSSVVRTPFPIWQITMPLGFVLIFAIGSLTAYYMVEGRFIFDLQMSREQLRIRTDVDKRESGSIKDEEATNGSETAGTPVASDYKKAKKSSR